MILRFLCLLWLCIQNAVPHEQPESVLLTRCFSETDIQYIDDWLQYHFYIGFDRIIVIDETRQSLLEEYIGMYHNHLTVLVDRSGDNNVVLDALNSVRRLQSWVLYLNVNEYLVLNSYRDVSSVIMSLDTKQLRCVYFGTSNQQKLDLGISNPFTLIGRFTSRSNVYTSFARNIILSSELPLSSDIYSYFCGTASLGLVVNVTLPFVAIFACRSAEEFLISISELASEVSTGNDHIGIGLIEKFTEYLPDNKLEKVVELVASVSGDTLLSEIHRSIRHLDSNSVPDYSLVTVQARYNSDIFNPMQWFSYIHNQPQELMKWISFRVDYASIVLSEREYSVTVDHDVSVFLRQPDNVHRVAPEGPSEISRGTYSGNSVQASDIDNSSLYCTLMHHLMGMYADMRVSPQQLDLFTDGFMHNVEGSIAHIDVDAVKAALLLDFNRYYHATKLTIYERIVDYYHIKRHEEMASSCFTSFETAENLKQDFLMLVVHHDDASLANIKRHLDLSALNFVVPVRIETSVFLEYIIYRDFLPDVLADLESYKYVLLTTHSTLTIMQPVVCGYEVSRLLSVAYEYDYDVIPLVRTKHRLLPSSVNMHTRNFKLAWDALLFAMGYSESQIEQYDFVTPMYRNSFIIKPHLLRKLTMLMRRATYIAEHHPKVKELLSCPMGHMYVGIGSSGAEESRQIAMNIFNTSYYQLYPFVFERLPIFFVLLEGASVCQHNDDCYTPEPDPVRPLP